MEAIAGGRYSCIGPFAQKNAQHPPCKLAKTTKEPTSAGLRHIATEQRRRDRINEGCVSQWCLISHDDLPGRAMDYYT